MRKYLRFVFLVMMVLTLPKRGMTQEVTDYLILQDIGAYKLHRQSRAFPDRKLRDIIPYKIYNGSAGILNATGHFVSDHTDVTYETHYGNIELDLGVSVQITQHSGSDSDKWLLHELDVDLRDYYGTPDLSYTVRNIDGNTVVVFSSGGRDYRWVSGNKAIMIEYNTSQMSKIPEPLEVVKTYLAKHPSTITPITLKELRNTDNTIKWIKDEIDRRLWLADNPKLNDKLDIIVKQLNVFLNYKEKYFVQTEEEKKAGITAKSEQRVLSIYLEDKDTESIKTKVVAYKTWWAAHKGDAISLQ